MSDNEHMENNGLVKRLFTGHRGDIAKLLGNVMDGATASPIHPGTFVRDKVVGALGLSVTDAAHALGVTRPALSALLNKRAHLSPEMALRIEKAFGVSVETLMRMQNKFDIAQIRKRAGDINVSKYRPAAAARQ